MTGATSRAGLILVLPYHLLSPMVQLHLDVLVLVYCHFSFSLFPLGFDQPSKYILTKSRQHNCY